MMNEWTFCN